MSAVLTRHKRRESLAVIRTTDDPNQVTFQPIPEHFPIWVAVLRYRYMVHLPTLGLSNTWTDYSRKEKPKPDLFVIDHIRYKDDEISVRPLPKEVVQSTIRANRNNKLVLVMHLYYTTCNVLVQGTRCIKWVEEDFERLQSLVLLLSTQLPTERRIKAWQETSPLLTLPPCDESSDYGDGDDTRPPCPLEDSSGDESSECGDGDDKTRPPCPCPLDDFSDDEEIIFSMPFPSPKRHELLALEWQVQLETSKSVVDGEAPSESELDSVLGRVDSVSDTEMNGATCTENNTTTISENKQAPPNEPDSERNPPPSPRHPSTTTVPSITGNGPPTIPELSAMTPVSPIPALPATVPHTATSPLSSCTDIQLSHQSHSSDPVVSTHTVSSDNNSSAVLEASGINFTMEPGEKSTPPEHDAEASLHGITSSSDPQSDIISQGKETDVGVPPVQQENADQIDIVSGVPCAATMYALLLQLQQDFSDYKIQAQKEVSDCQTQAKHELAEQLADHKAQAQQDLEEQRVKMQNANKVHTMHLKKTVGELTDRCNWAEEQIKVSQRKCQGLEQAVHNLKKEKAAAAQSTSIEVVTQQGRYARALQGSHPDHSSQPNPTNTDPGNSQRAPPPPPPFSDSGLDGVKGINSTGSSSLRQTRPPPPPPSSNSSLDGVKDINSPDSSGLRQTRPATPLRLPANTTKLIIGDSNLRRIEMKRLSASGEVQVRTFSGAKIADLQEVFSNFPQTTTIKRLVLHVGTNNISSGKHQKEDIDQLIGQYKSLITTVRSKLSEATVAVSAVPPLRTWSKLRTSRAFNSALRDMCKTTKTAFLSHDALWKEDREGRIDPSVLMDPVHLSPAGLGLFLRDVKSFLGHTGRPSSLPKSKSTNQGGNNNDINTNLQQFRRSNVDTSVTLADRERRNGEMTSTNGEMTSTMSSYAEHKPNLHGGKSSWEEESRINHGHDYVNESRINHGHDYVNGTPPFPYPFFPYPPFPPYLMGGKTPPFPPFHMFPPWYLGQQPGCAY